MDAHGPAAKAVSSGYKHRQLMGVLGDGKSPCGRAI